MGAGSWDDWGEKKKKRVWSEAEMADWKEDEARKSAAKKATVQALAKSWNNQAQPFRTDFLGEYESSDVDAANVLRSSLGIDIQSDPSAPGLTPAPMQDWSDMSIVPPWMHKSLEEHGWTSPMPVQAQAFPILLGGRNLIGIAKTGSGKTIAFMLPAVLHAADQRPLETNDQGPIVLVLAPTRELAVQISEETEKLTKYACESDEHPDGLRTTCFYGGGKKYEQLWKFSKTGSHFVVATPGRLLDCIAEGSVKLQRVTYFCLDEADRMLDLGFLGDMEQLSSTIRQDKQMAFFSATWPKEVQSLAHNLCTSGEPVTIRVTTAGKEHTEALQANESIQQEVVMIEEIDQRGKWDKQDEIKKKLLDKHIKTTLATTPDAKILIFVNTKTFADELCDKLWADQVLADAIHGGRQQEKRLESLDSFRKGETKVLIATDVIGRGLDIPNVTHVVVYSMNSVQDYVHRIGRTGRGVDGTGHALVYFEYMEKQPEIAGELVEVLERSNQPVPPELQTIADEVKSGVRKSFYDKWNNGGGGEWKSDWKSGADWKSNGKSSWSDGGDAGWKAGGWKDQGNAGNAAAFQAAAFGGSPQASPLMMMQGSQMFGGW